MTSAVLFVVPQDVASEQDHRVVLSAATLTRKGDRAAPTGSFLLPRRVDLAFAR